MSFRKARMFNNKAKKKKSRAEDILSALNLRNGDIIADYGSGGGHFTILFSKKVGNSGRVFAVDINRTFLEFIHNEANRKGIINIATIRTADFLNREETAFDLIFLRNVYHHLDDRTGLLINLKKKLSPGGRMAIIEHKKKRGLNFHSLFGHNVEESIIINEMKKAGFFKNIPIRFPL